MRGGSSCVGARGYCRSVSIALYRRYRPQRFADVIGQEHVTEPLMRALASGRVGHAYLFSGPRGCGKTTSARILARCLNCEQGPTPQPCGECPSCVALARGGPGSVDVIEIDAASHGGVEDARDLREKASYGPAQSRYKVYIIDEAHMVTPQGFNALLKIVEEPPEHVKFVFATTEPEKVIGTIRSRTHHYPFRLVPPSRVQDYLAEVCAKEGVAVEPGVLPFIVRASGGSVRDALSVLDQLIAGSGGEGLTYAGAAGLLGFTEGELLDGMIDAVAAGDGSAVFRYVDRVVETGQDPRRFVEDLLERFRDLIIMAALGERAGAVLRGVPDDQLDRMRLQAAAFGQGQLSHAADTVNTGLTELTGATSPRLQLELICARLLLPGVSGERGHAARLDRLERRLEMTGPPPPDPGGPGRTVGAGQPHRAPSGADPEPTDEGTGEEVFPSAGSVVAEATSAPSGFEGPRRRAAPRGGAAPGERGAAGEDGAGQEPAASGSPVAEAAPAPGAAPGGTVAAAESRTEPVGGPPRTSGAVDTEAIRRSWPDVLKRIFSIRRVTWTFLSEHAQVLDYDGSRLLLGIATKGLATTFRNGPHAEVVRQALIDALGVDARVEGIPLDEAKRAESSAGPRGARRSGQGGGSSTQAASMSNQGGDGSRGGDGDRSSPGSPAQNPGSRRSGRPGASDVAASDLSPMPGETGPPKTPPDDQAEPVDWALREPPPDEEEAPPPADEAGENPATSGRTSPSGQSARGRLKAARGQSGRGRRAADAPDDEIASEDDEDVAGGGVVGQPVIASVLGGTVIAEYEE